ncbi:MAG: metalloregulator ArsR/SmtB family transcription factor [Deltaproteobacteria bacterium]|nr:metalloregulator ArsR/SmtB family transcription factor [Deltaproteobacteria bacterium]
MCVCEVQVALGISQASVSKHLGILTAAGLLDRRKDGLWAYYRLAAIAGFALCGSRCWGT